MRHRILLAGLAVAGITATLSACSSSSRPTTSSPDQHSMPSGMSMPATSADHDGMDMSSGNGLSPTVNGYTLTLHARPMAGMAMPLTFTVTSNGRPVTAFDAEQTKLMHLYLIRADLTGFQHLHPTMSPDGTWTATPARLAAGTYRAYVQFVPHAAAEKGPLVLSRSLTVGGASASTAPIPAPGTTAAADGYVVTVSGTPKAGTETQLRLTVTRNGRPVTDLQPYLDTYAHVTAIHEGDLAFAHLHPAGTVHGGSGGPTLTVDAELPEPGRYRVFVQFQTAGRLHTAAFTIAAG